jgi:hypothetical protein
MTRQEKHALIAEKLEGMKIHSMDWPCAPDPECGCMEAAVVSETGEPVDMWTEAQRMPVYVVLPDANDGILILNPVPQYSDPSQPRELLDRVEAKITEMGYAVAERYYDLLTDIRATQQPIAASLAFRVATAPATARVDAMVGLIAELGRDA